LFKASPALPYGLNSALAIANEDEILKH